MAVGLFVPHLLALGMSDNVDKGIFLGDFGKDEEKLFCNFVIINIVNYLKIYEYKRY